MDASERVEQNAYSHRAYLSIYPESGRLLTVVLQELNGLLLDGLRQWGILRGDSTCRPAPTRTPLRRFFSSQSKYSPFHIQDLEDLWFYACIQAVTQRRVKMDFCIQVFGDLIHSLSVLFATTGIAGTSPIPPTIVIPANIAH